MTASFPPFPPARQRHGRLTPSPAGLSHRPQLSELIMRCQKLFTLDQIIFSPKYCIPHRFHTIIFQVLDIYLEKFEIQKQSMCEEEETCAKTQHPEISEPGDQREAQLTQPSIRKVSTFLAATMETGKQLSNVLKILRGNNCQPRTLYPDQLIMMSECIRKCSQTQISPNSDSPILSWEITENNPPLKPECETRKETRDGVEGRGRNSLG